MRMFRLAAAFVAALIFATLAPPAGMAVPVVTQPVFTLSSPSTPAGSPETFVITRVAGGAGVYVLFQTSDGTARAGVDYTATKQLIYLKGSTKTATVIVPTFVNSGSAVPLKFNAVIANTATPVRATGTIVEPTQTCPDGSVIAAAGTCPTPPPPATQTCPDGSVITASSTCPPPAPPPTSWVSAPLQDGGFARVKANDGLWDSTGPGAGRPLQAGEIVAVYFNGWESEADGRTAFAIYALSDGTSGRLYAADLEAVAPVGSPPGLPADWWVPGLVTANKTCTDPRQGHEGQPGVTQAGIYRAAMLAGSHKALASGEIGSAAAMWQVFATGDQSHTAFTVVTGDCLTGS